MSRYIIKVNGDEVGQSDSLPILSGNVEERSESRRVYYKYKGVTGNGKPYLVGPLYISEGYLTQPDIDDTAAMNCLVFCLLGSATSFSKEAMEDRARNMYNYFIRTGYMKLPFESQAYDYRGYSGNYTRITENKVSNEYSFTFRNEYYGSTALISYYPDTDSFSKYDDLVYALQVHSGNGIPAPTIYPDRIVIPSSTENSKKKFAISVNDSGEITATEVKK